MAGSTACNNISGLLYQVLHAFYAACLSFSGQCYGAGKYKRIDRLVLWGSGISASFAAVAAALITLAPYIFIGIFNLDPEVIRIGSDKLLIICWSYVLYSVTEVLMGCLRGMRQTAIPSIINIICVCVIRGLWILLFVPIYPGNHLFLFACYPISFVISFAAVLTFYLYKRRGLNRKPITA